MVLKLFPPRYHCYPPSLRYCGRATVLRTLCCNAILTMIQPVNCEQCFQGFNFNYLFITSVCLLIVSHVVSAFYWGICLKNGKQVVKECLCLADKIVMSWNLILGSSMSRRPVCCENKFSQVPSFRPHFTSHPAFLPPCWGQNCLGGRQDASPWGLARPWSREHGPGLDGQWCQNYR